MKKLFLLTAFFMTGQLFAVTSPYIETMLPKDRQVLAKSMVASADAYQQAGKKKLALDYKKAALEIFPIGDDAHILARQLDVTLDDEITYNHFVDQVDKYYKARRYQQALGACLMAMELRQPLDLYKKLYNIYMALGDKERAQSLESIINRTEMEGVSYEEGFSDEIIEDNVSEGYSANAVEQMDESSPPTEPTEEDSVKRKLLIKKAPPIEVEEEYIPEEYPLDGYGEEVAEPGMDEQVLED